MLTTLDDGIRALLADPHEQTVRFQVLDRLAEEGADPLVEALALVLRHRDSDGPRLLYAEACERQGDAERAEFVRVQCELAKYHLDLFVILEGDPRAKRVGELSARERKLLDAHRGDWFPLGARRPWSNARNDLAWITGGGGGGGMSYLGGDVRRGFVSAVTCDAASWLAHGDSVVATQPVERVRLTSRPVFAINFQPTRIDAAERSLRVRALVRWGDRKPMKFGHDALLFNEEWDRREQVEEELRDRVRAAVEDARWMGAEHGWWPGVEFTLPPVAGTGATVTMGGQPIPVTNWTLLHAPLS